MKRATGAADKWKSLFQKTPGPHPKWKQPLHQTCPHGLSIFIVNGTYVRNHFDSDFNQGGNGYRYRFVPKKELWIADETPESELALVAFHECHETELMKNGSSYENAHTASKRLENQARRRDLPGERRNRK